MAKKFGETPYQGPDTDGGAQSSLFNLVYAAADKFLLSKIKAKVAAIAMMILLKILLFVLKIILILIVVMLAVMMVVLVICMMIKGPSLIFTETMSALTSLSGGVYYDEEIADHRVESFQDADFNAKEWYYTYDEETKEMIFRYIDSEGVIQEKT